MTLNGLLRPLVQKTYGPEKIDPRNPPRRGVLGGFLSGQNHVSWLAKPADPPPRGAENAILPPNLGVKLLKKGPLGGQKGTFTPKIGGRPPKEGVPPNLGVKTPKKPHFWYIQGGTLGCDIFYAGFYEENWFWSPYFSSAPLTRGAQRSF